MLSSIFFFCILDIPSLNTKFATLSSVRKHKSVIKSIDTSQGKFIYRSNKYICKIFIKFYLSPFFFFFFFLTIGIDTLLFTSGAREELWCWKLEVTMPTNMKEGDLLNLNCLEWAVCPTVR